MVHVDALADESADVVQGALEQGREEALLAREGVRGHASV
jgi:hypothetical protein